jgi:hypothetical protein
MRYWAPDSAGGVPASILRVQSPVSLQLQDNTETVMGYKTMKAEDAQQWGELHHVTSNCMPFSALSLFVLDCIRPVPATPKSAEWSTRFTSLQPITTKTANTKTKTKKKAVLPRVSPNLLLAFMNLGKANLLNRAYRDDLLLAMVGAYSFPHVNHFTRNKGLYL